MIDFNSFILPVSVPKEEYITAINIFDKRYVIGGDPLTLPSTPDHNIFIIWDKFTLCVFIKAETKLPFDKFIEWYFSSGLVEKIAGLKERRTVSKREYTISRKFITEDGRSKCTRNYGDCGIQDNERIEQLEGDTVTLQEKQESTSSDICSRESLD